MAVLSISKIVVYIEDTKMPSKDTKMRRKISGPYIVTFSGPYSQPPL